MTRGVGWYLVGSVALLTLAGCSGGWFMEQREPWRHEAEVTCLKSGAVKITPAVAQMPAISGPGVCGADFPLKVAALGESAVLGFADELRPPAMIGPRPVAAPRYDPQPYPQTAYPPSPAQSPYGAPPPVQPGAPMSLRPPGAVDEDDAVEAYPTTPAPPYAVRPPAYRQRPTPYVSRPGPLPDPSYPPPRPYSTLDGPYDPPRAQPPEPYITPPPRTYGSQPAQPLPPLGPASPTLAAGPATVTPAATLACPMVSALDQWVAGSVQPAAMRWFGQPVVEIRQISAYSCRGMNGNPRAHISEHAFGNALDVAAFTLADGRKVTVQDGWRGLPEERAFLHDVHAAACQQFSTVLGPGSNAYHYNHLHLDLMRRSSGRSICNPAAVPGELIAGRMGYPTTRTADVTGSVATRTARHPTLGPAAKHRPSEARLPTAVAGED